MPSIGWGELLIILFIVLLLFGAKRLPEIGRSFGKTISGFKKGMKEAQEEEKGEEEKEEKS